MRREQCREAATVVPGDLTGEQIELVLAEHAAAIHQRTQHRRE